MIKPMIGCVLAFNLNANEQLQIVRHRSLNITRRFASKTHHFCFSVVDNRWYKFIPTNEYVGMFIEFYDIDQRRYNWLKEQVK